MPSFSVIRWWLSNLRRLARLLVSFLALLQVWALLPEGGRRAAGGGHER